MWLELICEWKYIQYIFVILLDLKVKLHSKTNSGWKRKKEIKCFYIWWRWVKGTIIPHMRKVTNFLFTFCLFLFLLYLLVFVLNDLQLNFYSLLVQWREIFPSKMGPFGSECFVDFGIALIFCKPKLFIVLNLL